MFNYTSTNSGRKFHFTDPQPEDICIEDIAVALSKLARFNGHTDVFYSVAEHSILVSYLVPPEHALSGLMHDAAEAYIGDMASPIKNLPEMAYFRELEEKIHSVICSTLGVPQGIPDEVKLADRKAVDVEGGLFWDTPPEWASKVKEQTRCDVRARNHTPQDLADAFLLRWKELTSSSLDELDS